MQLSRSIPVIRRAETRDADAIDALEQASFAHAGERLTPRRVRHLIRSPRFHVIVVEQDQHVLGWSAWFLRRAGSASWGRIYAIAVDPRARGRKIGRQLMEHMIDAVERRGAARIYLEARADNHAALRLYMGFGFVECLTLPDYYGKGLAAKRMVRVTASSPSA